MQTEGPIVSIVTLNVTESNIAAVTTVAGETLEQRIATLPGFVQGTVLANEGNTRIAVLTEWTSRDTWAKAEWNQEIENAVAHLFEITASYDLQFLFPLLSVKAPSI